MAVLSIVALYPTPTRRKIAVWPSETPRIWLLRYARVVPAPSSVIASICLIFPYPTSPSAS